ncbi:CBS domain-containing protein CBSCBSPB5-like [Nymphaea colorata]|nr:CBS domain-containing protein CBSCBSPB5-like [Nymphaea colorata]
MESGGAGHVGPLRKSVTKKKSTENGGNDHGRRSSVSSRSAVPAGERTVKRLRMSKALTVPDSTTVYEACRRMAARRVDAILVTDSNALLCGILTDKDIAIRVVAAGLNLEETTVAKVMTRNPVFVLSDTLSVEALQKMVQGKFRHLPVVENGEVIALLDIAKCLYDAIARMERAVEKGKAIAAAVEGVEKQWGTTISGPNTFLETLRERMFRPSLSTIISEKTKVATVSPTDSVLTATKKMLELHASSAIVTVGNKPQGILTSKDILMRVITQNLPPQSTPVEKVMTPNPECATVDTPIVDALHVMHDGKFLHLPVVDRDGLVVAVIDVIQITHAAISTIGTTGVVGSETTSTMMQKFWDSAMSMGDDEDTRSEGSATARQTSEGTETGRLGYMSELGNTFGFKLEDKRGRMHRFNCDTGSMTELIACIIQRVGDDIDRNHLPQIMYEDEEHDKVVLATDSDLAAAVEHARVAGLKGLRLYLDYSGSGGNSETTQLKSGGSGNLELARKDAWATAYSTVAAGAALIAGLGVMAYLRRANS